MPKRRRNDQTEPGAPPKRPTTETQAGATRADDPAVTCAKEWLLQWVLPISGICDMIAKYASKFQGTLGCPVEVDMVDGVVPIGVDLVLIFKPGGIADPGGNAVVVRVNTGEVVCHVGCQSAHMTPLLAMFGGIAVMGNDRTISIFCATSQDDELPTVDVRTIPGHPSPVTAMAEMQDGTLASGDATGGIRVSDLNSGEVQLILTGHSREVYALTVLSDGRLVSGSGDRRACVWSQDGTCLHVLEHHDVVMALAPLPDGKFASATLDGAVLVWDAMGTCTRRKKAHMHHPTDFLASLSDGTLLAASSSSREVAKWNPGGCLTILPASHTSSVVGLTTLPDGQLLSIGQNGMVCVTDPVTGEFITLEGTEQVLQVAVVKKPDSNMYTLVVAQIFGGVKIFLF